MLESPRGCVLRSTRATMRPLRHRVSALLCAGLAWSSVARAEDNFLHISLAGDGTTPTAMSRFADLDRQMVAPRASVAVSDRGDASWNVKLDLPPALLAPSVALTYSSAGSDHSFISRGWSIDAGMTITRITGVAATHAYSDLSDLSDLGTYRIGGGGLDGMLYNDGTRWTYVSTGGVGVVADLTGGVWTIDSGGVRTTLQATIGDVEWHATRARDTHGNTVLTQWDGNRIARITYGGTTTPLGAEGEPPLVEVTFVYAPTATSYEARHGTMDEISHRLTDIQVVGQPFGASIPKTWSLSYTSVLSQPALSSVSVSDDAGGVLLASFGYAAYPDVDAEPEVSDEPAPPLGGTNDHTSVTGAPGTGRRFSGMYDVTGDGLSDSAYGVPEFLVGDEFAEETRAALDSTSQEETATIHCGFDLTVALRRMVDVDGDGFADLVDSLGPVPNYETDPDAPDPSYCAGDYQAGDDGATWIVRYRSRDGFLGDPVEIDAPVAFPRIAVPLDVDSTPDWHIPEQQWDPGNDRLDVDLVDLDGDGWLDIVQVMPIEGEEGYRIFAWYHTGSHDGGWADEAVDLTSELPDLEASLWSLTESRIHQVATVLDPLDPRQLQSVRVDEVRLLQSLMDINGDGTPDLVDSGGWSRADRYWTVYLGTGLRGVGAFADAIAWRAPRPYLGRTNEGFPFAPVCALPGEFRSADVGIAGPDLNAPVDTLGQPLNTDLSGLFAGAFSGPGFDATCYQQTDSCGDSIGGDDDGEEQEPVGDETPGWAAGQQLPPPPTSNLDRPVQMRVQGLQITSPCGAGYGALPDLELAGLVDMDGDGRLDMVDAESSVSRTGNTRGRRWWRNLGAGFEAEGRPLPEWFPYALGATVRHQAILRDEDAYEAPSDIVEDRAVATAASSYVWWTVTDYDRDGMPDWVQTVREFSSSGDEHVVYGPRAEAGPSGVGNQDYTLEPGTARPGLLTSVTSQFGAQTQLAYASSSTFWPTEGSHLQDTDPALFLDPDLDVPQMAAHRDVVVAVATRDPITGHAGHTQYNYVHGVCDGGICEGFSHRDTYVLVHDPAIHPAATFQAMSRVREDFELGRDFAVPLRRTHEFDALDPVPSPGSRAFWAKDLELGFTYDSPRIGTAAVSPRTRWLKEQRNVEYLFNEAAQRSAPRTYRTTLLRDKYGNITEAQHLSEDCAESPTRFQTQKFTSRRPTNNRCALHHDDDVRVVTSWISNDDPGSTSDVPSLFVPKTMTTYGRSDTNPSWVAVESALFAYDAPLRGPGDYAQTRVSAGLLTGQRLYSGVGNALTGEYVEWAFNRNERGAIGHSEAPGDRITDTEWTFGEALPELQINGEGHEVHHVYDELGRETQTTDPNGVVTFVDHDVLGRVLTRSVQPVGGADHLVEANSYVDATGGRITTTRTNYRPDGAPVTRTEIRNLDGFGDAVQTWMQREEGIGWIVHETVNDIFGQQVRTSWPRRRGTFGSYATTRGSDFLAWTLHDASGRPRQTWEDKTSGLGRVDYDYEKPGWSESTDAGGAIRVLHKDTLGRLVGVMEGSTIAAPVQTGTWGYDARDRVTGFVDAAMNAYGYVYDGAGRLRSVGRGAGHDEVTYHQSLVNPNLMVPEHELKPGNTNGTGWYAYYYADGPHPLVMYEGTSNTPVAQWNYDALGRPLSKSVLNRATGDTYDYTWEWDVDPEDPDAGWIGARRAISDPDGRVDYHYDAGPFGRLGQLSSIQRTWADGTTAAFAYTYDFDGSVRTTQWPDLRTVRSSYHRNGWLAHQDITAGTATLASLDFAYDSFGLPDGWTGGAAGQGSFDTSTNRTTPTRVPGFEWTMPNGTTQSVDYTWFDEGLLRSRDIGGFGRLDYGYDTFRRVRDVMRGSVALEQYSYDSINNLTSMFRQGEGT